MKCDELQYERIGDANKTYPASTLVIRKQFVDEAIAELNTKLEDVQASEYAESVDAGMENRKLKRALWLARVKRVLAEIAWFKLFNASISTMNPDDGARQAFDKWRKILTKLTKKAEEYK